MQRRFVRSDLAAWHLFTPEVKELVDEVLLNHQDALEALAANPSRSPKVFPAIYGKKLPPADTARAAVSHRLTAGQAMTIASRERRVTVLEQFLRHNEVTEEVLRLMAAKANPATCREILTFCEDVPGDLRPVLAIRAGGITAIQECCYGSPEQFPDELVLGVLADESVLTHASIRSHALQSALQVLFSRRPALAAQTLQAGRSTGFSVKLAAAATSSNLAAETAELIVTLTQGCKSNWQMREPMVGLARNPFTPPSVIEKILSGEFRDDHGVRQAVASRKGFLQTSLRDAATPEELAAAISFASGHYWDVSIWSILEMLGNPRIPDSALTDRRSLLGYRTRGAFERAFRAEMLEVGLEPAPRRLPSDARAPREPSPESLAEMTEVAEILGTDRQAWETFAGLMNEFDGTLVELAGIASCV